MSKEILESMRFFDLNDEREGLAALDAMSGISTLPTSEIVPDEANGGTPLADSISLIQFRETPAWQSILSGVEILKQDLEKKSKDISLIRDERFAAADRLEGINIVMAFIGFQFQAAQERMANLSSDEKVRIGKETPKQVQTLPAEVIAAKTTENKVTEKQITDNTARAVEFLSKGAK